MLTTTQASTAQILRYYRQLLDLVMIVVPLGVGLVILAVLGVLTLINELASRHARGPRPPDHTKDRNVWKRADG